MLDGNVTARDATQHARQLRHTRLDAGADVEGPRIQSLGPRQRMRRGEEAALGDVANEHIVARLRTVSEDGERPPIENAAAEDGDDSRLAMRILPRTVDIREAHRGSVHAVDTGVIREIILGAQLRDAVWRLGVLREVLDVRRIDEIAVQRAAGGGEDETRALASPALPEGFDQVQRAADVDARVLHRIGDALPDIDLRREMHDHIDG